MEGDDDIPGLIGDLIRFGTIETVDLGAGKATVRAGDIVTPDLPWFEWGGAFRTWHPPTVGEQVVLFCAEGDIAHGVIMRGLFSTTFPKLGEGENPQIHGPDGLVITLAGDGIQITAPGGVTIEGDVSVTGTINASEDVIADGISLKSHPHGGVQSGGSYTDPPS